MIKTATTPVATAVTVTSRTTVAPGTYAQTIGVSSGGLHAQTGTGIPSYPTSNVTHANVSDT